jgi:tRNA(Ile)-lysidine synthetase-like protein
VEELRGASRQLTALHVKQVLRLAGSVSSGRRIELPGAIAERNFEWLWFAATEKAGTRPASRPSNKVAGDELGNAGIVSEKGAFLHRVSLQLTEKEIVVAVPEIRKRFSLKVFDWIPLGSETRALDVLDGDLLRSPLVLRNWQPGDSFQPQGRRHVHKLKQLLREKRVALRDRRGWPVLTSAGQLVWTRGCPVAAPFAAGHKTRSGVAISEEEF